MQVKSAKAKGRKLQNWVRERLLFHLGLEDDEVTTAIMGEAGADVKLLKTKQYLFDYVIECKSQKKGFTAVYNAMCQCVNHTGSGEPLLVIKQDREHPLVVINAEYFFRIHRR